MSTKDNEEPETTEQTAPTEKENTPTQQGHKEPTTENLETETSNLDETTIVYGEQTHEPHKPDSGESVSEESGEDTDVYKETAGEAKRKLSI